MKLNDKVAIVTGGSRGIGRAIVLALCKEGARVVFSYLTNGGAAAQVAVEAKDLGAEVISVKADVRNFDDTVRVAEEALSRFGRIDLLVNNAGITKDKALMMMDPSDWRDVIDTNLTGYFNMSKSCIVSMMKQKSGAIVNVSSVAGVVGLPRQVNYSSAKAGEIGFTKSLAKEVASFGVRVNAVAPGFIDTDMTKDLRQRELLLKMIPRGRFGDVSEVANVVIFLLSEEASYITGQVIKIDGGLTIG